MERSKNILIAALSLACLCLPGCSQEEPSPSSFPGYFTPEGQYIDFEDRNESLPAPFDRIKLDYYRQEFVGKGIDRDSEFIETHHETFSDPGTPIYPHRLISINSLCLLNFFGVIDGAYFVSFDVNGQAPTYQGWAMDEFQCHSLGKYELFTRTRVPPVFWKDGRIYSIRDALALGVISERSLDEAVVTGPTVSLDTGKVNTVVFPAREWREVLIAWKELGEEVTWEVSLAEPTINIRLNRTEFWQNLPPLEADLP